jgi:hypothetical protein
MKYGTKPKKGVNEAAGKIIGQERKRRKTTKKITGLIKNVK